jgi:hypothetical protein
MKNKLYDFLDKRLLLINFGMIASFSVIILAQDNKPVQIAAFACVFMPSVLAAGFVIQEATNRSYAKARQRLQDQRDSASSDWDGIVRCADDILPRLRLLLGRMEQDQQEVNDLCELSSRIAEGDQAADSYDWDGIVQCADDIESRLRVLRGRTRQNQQEVNDLRYRYELSSRLAESDQTANS